MSSSSCAYSIVVETYNYVEGTSLESVRRALTAALNDAAANNAEVILADVSRGSTVARILAAEFHCVRRVDAGGIGYDEAKALAARDARSPYVLYLDCDCVPQPGWFQAMLKPLREGRAAAVGGFARYPGGFFRTLCSLMDFGFLMPRVERPLGCYASNNSAFLRDVLLRIPEPDGPMRCRCYAHAQELARRGFPVIFAAGAAVDHEPPPFVRERLRQGYDMVAACWVDPSLPEAGLAARKLRAVHRFYRLRLQRDFHTLRLYGRELGLRAIHRWLAYPALAMFRLIDLVGIAAALALGPRARRWVDRAPADPSEAAR